MPSPAMAPPVAELVRAEQECCPFFGFVMRLDERGLSLEVTAPPEARLLVDDLLGDRAGRRSAPSPMNGPLRP